MSAWLALCAGCVSKPALPPAFEALDHTKTGLHFANQLNASRQFNLFKYMYFYNGAGVGAGGHGAFGPLAALIGERVVVVVRNYRRLSGGHGRAENHPTRGLLRSPPVETRSSPLSQRTRRSPRGEGMCF